MEKTDILIFDVGLGQSVFVYPHTHPEYGMLIDCGHVDNFHPIDFLIEKKFINDKILNNLTITNYDQDHFSDLPYLRTKVGIRTVNFATNLTTTDIKDLKEKPHTEALRHLCDIKDKYTMPAVNYTPPYRMVTYHLNKEHLDNHDTNNLSQVVFIEHYGTIICISGDLEEKGWTALLEKVPGVKEWLKFTNIFIASHHGRDNGYCPDIFPHCKPECIVISDKGIVHETQRNMSTVYANHVVGDGIFFNDDTVNKRKVLTTRSDGHIWIQLTPLKNRAYRNFRHE